MIGFAAPAPSSKTAAPGPGSFKPVVIKSLLNGVSPAVRNLPIAAPTGPREIEHDLPRVKPSRLVPTGFVDASVLPFAVRGNDGKKVATHTSESVPKPESEDNHPKS
jgi:hypothetical protein